MKRTRSEPILTSLLVSNDMRGEKWPKKQDFLSCLSGSHYIFDTEMTTNNNSLIDDFETAFQSCLSSLTNPSTVHIHDSDEVKTSVEQTSLINETVANSDGSHPLQRQTSLNQSMTGPQTPLGAQQPPQSQPPLRHTIQSGTAGNGPHLMRPSMGPQMSGPMTPPQMMASGQMSGPVGMLPPPPPQTAMTGGQQTNMGPMMGQMQTQQSGQPMGQQFMPQQQQQQQPHPVGLQGPLAYLERTTSNIGLPDSRR
ncbi:unnamed protein product [Medioppia subpectinata]|uniref:Mediator of RNA polymerase II transcription subunit 28 n=1 Tax=Medioppia subpectinata TaxID=1979941 RepID=A0A7R9KLI1_9ACAR|nr:unnamed protein product [Medioppia subpectinata]CAG2104684.1 unnamed protein product [Medioppia subpectinata]